MQGRLSFESAVSETYAAAPAWSGTYWTLYDTITIEADEIDDDLTDFPVYVDLSDLSASFWSTVSDGGGDIRVTTNDGSPTEVPREVVFASTSLETGELYFKAGSLSSTTDSVFRIYYNGSTTAAYADADTYGAENVWTNDFFGVWHMQQDPTGTIYDSTANGRDGTSAGTMTSGDLVVGQFGNAIDFDGTDDYISLGNFSEPLSSMSVSTWIEPDVVTGNQDVLAVENSWYTYLVGNDYTFFSDYSGTNGEWYVNNSINTNQYQYVHTTFTDIASTASDPWLYVNGSSYNTGDDAYAEYLTPTSAFLQPNADLVIAGYGTTATYDGNIDEIRLASTTRSEAWVAAEFVNQKTPDRFYRINSDPAQTWNATDWTLYDTITIDATQVDATLTDFPVYVDLADLSSQFWSTTDSVYPGVDIRVTNTNNTELPRELVAASSTAQTGELHFKADSISSSADTTFRIWYNGTTTDDYATDATYGAENVWTNGYVGVWHMQEDPTGIVYDSTGNGLDAASGGAMTSSDSVSGSLGSAVDFDGTNDIIHSEIYNGDLGAVTVTSWINPNSYGEGGFGRIAIYADAVTGFTTFITGSGFNRLQGIVTYTGTTGQWGSETDSLVTGKSQYIVWNKEDLNAPTTQPNVSIDGTDQTITTIDAGSGSYVQTIDAPFIIGNTSDQSRTFDGYIDEVRFASTTRSAAWISAEHLNQATTTDFYTVASYSSRAAVAWNATDWTLYDTITIDATQVDATLTDFPVYVDLADLSSQFWSTTDSVYPGVDIRVTNTNNTELPRELVAASSTAQTGELHFKADSISSSADTTFRIWYNGTTTDDYATDATYGAENVWTNGYVGVWHMNEDPTGIVVDSTSHNRSATTTGSMTSGDVVNGAVGNALNFDGDDEINTGLLSMTVSEVSTELWVRPTVLNDAWHYLAWAGGTFGSRILGWSTDHYSFANSYSTLYGDWSSPSGSATVGDFQHMYFGRDVTSTANDAVIYKNAVSQTITEDSTPGGTFLQPNVDLYLGGGGGGSYFIGDLDEIRVATTTRSDAWISAAYLNQSTTTDFYATEAFVPAPIWNATAWTAYDTITIDASRVSASLTDFPVYIDLSHLSPQFWSTTPSGASLVGTDIRVTNSSNTELPRELVFASSTAQTGELHFKADSISSSVDTEFRIWYNGTTTGDYATDATYGAENVWTNEYVGVWHFEEDPSGGTGVVLDSTVNDLDGTGSTTMTTSDLVAGKLGGYAYDFDGNEAGSSSSYINFGSDPVLDNLGNTTVGMSICTWYEQDSIPTNDAMLVSKSQSYYGGNMLYVAYDRLGMETYNDDWEEANYSPGEWQYMCGTWDGTDGLSGINLYIDAVDTTPSNTSTSATVTDDASYDLTIGNLASGGYAIDGRMDELRISSTTRSAGWIETEYVNQYNPASFYTVAANVPAAPVWNDSNWVFYDTLTIDADQVDADLTDFPVFVNLSDLSSTFWTTTPSSASLTGTDIRVTNSSDTELPRELVFASSTTKQGEIHFKADSISSSTDTVFKIWYNGNTAGDYLDTATYGSHNVWTNDYLGVWHMNEDPTGAVRDSTSFNRAGVSGGSMTSSDRIGGAVGNAISFDGSDDFIDAGNFSETLTDLSISAWIRPETYGESDEDGMIWSLSADDYYFGIYGSTDKDLYWNTDFATTDGSWSTAANTIDVDAFQHVYAEVSTITSIASNAAFYIDGTAMGSTDEDTAPTGSHQQPNSNVYIGNWSDQNDTFDGEIDELRVSSTTRAAAWIAAEYANQQNTENFYTIARSTDEQVRTEVFSDVMSGATWQVPPEVYSITVKAWGAGGGGGGGGDAAGGNGGNGGAGGFIEGTISVTPGEILSLYVGGGGQGGEHVFDDGGSSGGGGGYSGVFRSTTPLFVAGAGGGAGGGGENVAGEDGGDGGPGGGSVGSNGVADGGANFGYGGTQSAGGAGGAATDNVAAEDGAYLSGGDGIETSNVGVAVEGAGGVNGGGNGASGSSGNRGVGGGGGAGYYGGGGGTGSADGGSGGGGGSSYVVSSAIATTTETGTTVYPPRATDAAYVFGAGEGGVGLMASDTAATAENGGNGLVVIQYEYKPAAEWNISDWKEYELITIDSANIDEVLTDFPVYVDLSDLSEDFWNGISSNGTDIRVTTDAFSPVELPREVVSASTSLMTGELHFKADSISATTDTSFRIYYNGSIGVDYQPDDTYGAENVWTNDYVGVWHMDDDPSGVAYDSSPNRNHGVAEGSMVLGDVTSSSQVGEGLVFDGSDQMLNLGDIDDLDVFGEATFSIWANRTSDNTGASTNHTIENVLFAQSATVGNDNFELGTAGTDYEFYLDTFDSSVTGSFASNVSNSTWFNTHLTYASTSANELKIYKDGSLVSQDATWGGDFDPTSQASFTIGGARPEGDSWGEFIGTLDEARVALAARSAAWISAEYLNQYDPVSFYGTTSPQTGSTTIAVSDGGQVSDAFDMFDKTNEALFSFKLTPNSGNATVTEMTLELTGTHKVKANDFSNIRLLQDNNNNAGYNDGDTVLDATGIMRVTGQVGTITFDSDFLLSAATNYVVVADWNAPKRGASMSVALPTENIIVVDSLGAHQVYGSAGSVQHNYDNQNGGGSAARVSEIAPAGDGVVVGGDQSGGGAFDSNTGGDLIGTETDFFWPTELGVGSWTNAVNAYDETDGTYATANTNISQAYTTFGDTVPVTDTIEGIEVKLEVSGTTAAGDIDIELSWDNGTSWTTAENTGTLPTTDTVLILGGESNDWGHSWTPAQIGSFQLRATANPSSNTVRIDGLQVKVYHQASGGSGGGGGRF